VDKLHFGHILTGQEGEPDTRDTSGTSEGRDEVVFLVGDILFADDHYYRNLSFHSL
jgi:hypothetical protein